MSGSTPSSLKMERIEQNIQRGTSVWNRPVFAACGIAASLSVNSTEHPLDLSDFAPATKCADCHFDIYQQWQSSAHSQTATDPNAAVFCRSVSTLAAQAGWIPHRQLRSPRTGCDCIEMAESRRFPSNERVSG